MNEVSDDNRTIAAISTGLTAGGIGIVRISGPEAVAAAEKIFRGREKLTDSKSGTVHYGHIVYDGETIDEVLVTVMRAPKTYTREDVVEINCHGGIYVLMRVLDTVLKNGVRLAMPGEFTKRAFLNGRVDLTEAEAVMDLIESDNELARKTSLSQLGGALRSRIADLRGRILYESAYIESAMDDPEHYDLTGYAPELRRKVVSIQDEIRKMYETSGEGRLVREGIATVILGKPNVGKSSIMNLISGADTAIVTDVAGTTRDVLEEKVCFSGLPIRIMDTAGIRKTENVVEKIGVERALRNAENADLILCVIDSSSALDENDSRIIEMIRGRKAVVLLNKNDLPPVITVQDLEEKVDAPVISISAKTGSGMDEVIGTIRKMFFHGDIDLNHEVYITNIRHKEALKDAMESLSLVLKSIDSGMPEDFYTIDLMDAYHSLGSITGEEAGEDLINEIFSKFCMGK